MKHAIASLWIAAALAPVAAQGRPYAKDVAFLLDACEEHAGALLRQKGIDWRAVRAEFTRLVRDVNDDVAHVELCGRLLARLQDGHAGFTELKVQMPRAEPTHGTGVALCENGAKVLVWSASGAAAEAGLAAGMEVVQIDGKKAGAWLTERARAFADRRGFSTVHAARHAACQLALSGPPGTKFELVVTAPDKGKRKLVLECDRANGDARFVGSPFPPATQPLGKRGAFGRLAPYIGYIALRDCPGELPQELDAALAALGNDGELRGLVLDCRANRGGGTDHEAVFGRFVPAGTQWRQYPSAGARPYGGPLVVIVDAGTVSAGETVAGQFKEDGRGYLLGPSATHGMSSQKTEVAVPSGLFTVRISTRSNKQRFNGGRGIEGLGVAPHEIVAPDAKLLGKGEDPLLVRAVQLLRDGFPKGSVPYEPPR